MGKKKVIIFLVRHLEAAGTVLQKLMNKCVMNDTVWSWRGRFPYPETLAPPHTDMWQSLNPAVELGREPSLPPGLGSCSQVPGAGSPQLCPFRSLPIQGMEMLGIQLGCLFYLLLKGSLMDLHLFGRLPSLPQCLHGRGGG